MIAQIPYTAVAGGYSCLNCPPVNTFTEITARVYVSLRWDGALACACAC